MIYHHTGSKDTYITNKILNDARRATDANVGFASTIDLFKLHNENTLPSTSGDIQEISRGLIYFDLDGLKSKIQTDTSLTSSSLKIELVYKDIQGSQVAPSNFTLELYQVAKTWDEGLGNDIVGFSDLAATNWVSSSLGTEWSSTGGDVTNYGSDNYIAQQTFTKGTEDLRMDVTAWVKAHWADESAVPNHGWLLKFTAAEETNAKSYFVKRFASRHTRNEFLRPKLEVSWENYHIDDRLNFEAGTANNIAISNIRKNSYTNLSEVPAVTLSRGAWSKTNASVSQIALSGITQAGRYNAAVGAIDIYGTDSALAADIIASGSVLLQEQWTINSGAQIVHSGSITMYNPLAVNTGSPKDIRFSLVDLKATYTKNDKPVIRLFVNDRGKELATVRQPVRLPSTIVNKVYYQIKDFNSKQILIPFSDKLSSPNESTRISADGTGMYFCFPISVLPRGRTYTIELAHYDRGNRRIFETKQAFRVQ